MWNWSLMRLLTTLFFVYWIPLRRKLENCSLQFTFIITSENLREILQIIEFLENNHVARFFIFENKHRLRIFRPRKPVSGHGEGGTGFVIRRNARRGLWHPNPVKDDTYVYWSERFFKTSFYFRFDNMVLRTVQHQEGRQ